MKKNEGNKAMKITKLSEHKYANCGYYQDAYFDKHHGYLEERGMVSYTTRVIIIRNCRVLYTGDYSRTTSKQVAWWLEEYGWQVHKLTLKNLKELYNKGMAYNLRTNAIEPLTDDEKREIKEIRRKAFYYGYGL